MTEPPVPDIDTSRPHAARIYDYVLGGKNHFAVDREMAKKALAAAPTARISVRENRAFLGRAVRYLAAEAGVRQFLDIGTGLPTTGNVHEIAQEVAPESRVVYADNDPLVLAHARALLTSSPEGRTAYRRVTPTSSPGWRSAASNWSRRAWSSCRSGTPTAPGRGQRRPM